MELPEWKKGLELGQEIKIIACIHGHKFDIGAHVIIKQINRNDILCKNKFGSEEWYIHESEFIANIPTPFSFEAVAHRNDIGISLRSEGILIHFDEFGNSKAGLSDNKKYKVTVEEV